MSQTEGEKKGQMEFKQRRVRTAWGAHHDPSPGRVHETGLGHDHGHDSLDRVADQEHYLAGMFLGR